MSAVNKVKKAVRMDWRSIIGLLRQMKKESGRGFADLFADMKRCYEPRGFTWRNYATFGFHMLTDEAIRDTYISQSETDDITGLVNSPESYAVLRDKGKAARQFKPYFRRDFFDLREGSAEQFAQFVKKHDVVFAKYVGQMLSRGIERFKMAEIEDTKALYDRLKAAGKYLVEEGIVQHPEMARLSLDSVNTMRIATCRHTDGTVTVPYVTLRTNLVDGYFDNTAFKGAWTPIQNFKSVTHPFYNNSRSIIHIHEHPTTKFKYVGFEIPFIEESMEMVKAAADLLPEARYIGWDVAVTPDGPLVVEANYTPTPEYYQIYGMMKDNIGCAAVLEKALGMPVTRPHRKAAGMSR